MGHQSVDTVGGDRLDRAAASALAVPSIALATSTVGQGGRDLVAGHPGQYLRAVAGSGYQVPVAEIDERDGPAESLDTYGGAL
jgi:hypothetical protein